MNIHAVFRQRLAQALTDHPDPIRAIAKRAGYTPEYVSELAGFRTRNSSNPTLATVWAIAGALKVDPFWLLGK